MAGTSAKGVNKQSRVSYQAIKDISQGKHSAITKFLKIIGVSQIGLRQRFKKAKNCLQIVR